MQTATLSTSAPGPRTLSPEEAATSSTALQKPANAGAPTLWSCPERDERVFATVVLEPTSGPRMPRSCVDRSRCFRRGRRAISAGNGRSRSSVSSCGR